MQTLYEQAYESARLNCKEESYELRENYCEGYYNGAKKAIEILESLPEYKDAVDFLKWKLGIK